jgi:pimeloyl-ACP methyl ester carboxylesterase
MVSKPCSLFILVFMSKTIFIIPGFKTQVKDPLYNELVTYLKSRDYVVQAVPITWNNKTVSQNAIEFVRYFNENKGNSNYVLGFSYGAVIALMTAEIVDTKKLILCSLSPDFKEDSNAMPTWLIKYIGKNRFADTLTRSANKFAKKLTVETIVFYGEKEGIDYPQLKIRSEQTAKLAPNSKLIVIKDAPHDISFPTYVEAIKKVF